MKFQLSLEVLYNWLDRRINLKPLGSWAGKKVVPSHSHSFWYYMGGILLVFLAIQLVTGILLMVYYIPELKSAHASILNINSQVDFGWFVRSMHSWGANLMILTLFIHMFSTYFMKAYRPPREITWWTGFMLTGIVFGLGFTGYLLPWTDISFFATKIGVDIASLTPMIGDQLALLLKGGEIISQAALSRFFTLHVIVLPLMLLIPLLVHLVMIQAQGMSEPESFKTLPDSKKEYEKFFPTFILKDFMGWMAVVNLLAVLVAIFPWGVEPEADPFKPAPAGIRPEWYFLFMFQFFKLLPGHIGPLEGEQLGMILFGLVAVSLLLMPFWDNGESGKKGRLATWYGIVLVISFIILTVWGFLS